MKKYLLSLAVAAMALTASAESYTLFDIDAPGTWEAEGTGFKKTVEVDGVSFVITTDQANSTTTLLSPDANSYSWRVYKGSSVSIESSVALKTIVVTFDSYTSGTTTYYATWDLSDGWEGVLDEQTYTIVSDGLTSFTGTSTSQQTRIKTLVVSTDETVVDPVTPVDDNVVYSNNFGTSIDDWNNDGWYVNSSIGCAVANSYKDGANQVADYLMYRAFDLSSRKNCALSVDQAFGFYFPTEQVDNFTLLVRESGDTEWYPLVFTSFPDTPSGNWSKFATNEFDLSEFDGSNIELGFRYVTDGTISRAWELKNFKLTGELTEGGVAGIAAEDNSAAVYYNLQGVRVANPEKGLYIRVSGNKATKVAL